MSEVVGRRVASLMSGAASGDMDPLDVCVLGERPITRAEVLLSARVVGGIPMLDDGQADDKIVAVLLDDPVYGDVTDIVDVPAAIVDRLRAALDDYRDALEAQAARFPVER